MTWIATLFLHLLFARIDPGLFRYEAYLILMGVIVIAQLLTHIHRFALSQFDQVGLRVSSFAIIIALCLIPVAYRTGMAYTRYPVAVKNIYEQQYQMARFIRTYYNNKTIVANDIGAISYLNNIHLIDLVGLGSIEVAQARQNAIFNRQFVAELAQKHNVDLIVIYDSWFEDAIPDDWVRVGQWKIIDNVICADDTVSFYVLSQPEKIETAIANLRQFSSVLPVDVIQSGMYLDS